jgi:xylono-1,5-lactonase
VTTHVTVFPERPRVAVPCGALLGEGPIWDGRTGTLFWVDIKGHTLWRWRPGEGGDAQAIGFDEEVAFVQLTPDPDTVILGQRSGLVRYGLAGGDKTELLRPEPDRPGNRLNDAGVGPDGTLYFGSMDNGETEPTGAFYRWSAGGLERFGRQAVVTNGPTVDPGRGLVYTADSQNRVVYRHRLDGSGRPDDGETFVTFGEGDGHPDGLTIDAEGHLWVCHFGGSRVTRFDPDGTAVLEVPMPTAQVTKVAFGGPDLATLYITTAAIGRDRETDLLAGHLFAAEVGIAGIPAVPCRMPG